MRYLLDTNACIRILNASSPILVIRLKQHQPAEIRLCSVVKAELLYGAYKSSRTAHNLRTLAGLFAQFASVDFDDVAADLYGSIRAHLEAGGQPIGPNDLMIAAIARAHRLTLVTHNLGEFLRIPNLAVEDWEAP